MLNKYPLRLFGPTLLMGVLGASAPGCSIQKQYTTTPADVDKKIEDLSLSSEPQNIVLSSYSVGDFEYSLKTIRRYLRGRAIENQRVFDASLLCALIPDPYPTFPITSTMGNTFINDEELERQYSVCKRWLDGWKVDHPQHDDGSIVLVR